MEASQEAPAVASAHDDMLVTAVPATSVSGHLSQNGPDKALGVDGRDETGCFLFGAEDENWYGAWFPTHTRLLPRPQAITLDSGKVWIYRAETLLYDWSKWQSAEFFVDSRKILVVQNMKIVLLLPILNIRTKVPKSRRRLGALSHRRLKIDAYNFNGEEEVTCLLEIKLDTPEKQCELRHLVTAFRILATPKTALSV